MADLSTILPAAGVGGLFTWLGNIALHRWTARDKRQLTTTKAQVELELHRDQLTFEILETAQREAKVLREEITAARAEAAISRSLQNRLAHFTEALDHIAALLSSGSPEEQKANERRATAFLNRMRRLADAEGTLRNEQQLNDSARALDDLGSAVLPVREEG